MNPKRVRGYRNDNDNTNDNGAEIRKKPMCKKKEPPVRGMINGD